MTTATTRYLLDCRCGEQVPVDAGQAGRTVTCICGATLDVPPMRQLVARPLASGAPPEAPLWTARHGLIFLGLVLVLAGSVLCTYLAINYPQIDEVRIRKEVADLPFFDAWRNFAHYRNGVFAAESLDAATVREQRQSIDTWLIVGGCVTAVGAVLALVAFLQRRRPAATR